MGNVDFDAWILVHVYSFLYSRFCFSLFVFTLSHFLPRAIQTEAILFIFSLFRDRFLPRVCWPTTSLLPLSLRSLSYWQWSMWTRMRYKTGDINKNLDSWIAIHTRVSQIRICVEDIMAMKYKSNQNINLAIENASSDTWDFYKFTREKRVAKKIARWITSK